MVIQSVSILAIREKTSSPSLSLLSTSMLHACFILFLDCNAYMILITSHCNCVCVGFPSIPVQTSTRLEQRLSGLWLGTVPSASQLCLSDCTVFSFWHVSRVLDTIGFCRTFSYMSIHVSFWGSICCMKNLAGRDASRFPPRLVKRFCQSCKHPSLRILQGAPAAIWSTMGCVRLCLVVAGAGSWSWHFASCWAFCMVQWLLNLGAFLREIL